MKLWLGTFLALAVSSGAALAKPSIVITQQDIQQVKSGVTAQPAAITNKDLPRDEDYRVPQLDPVAPPGYGKPGHHPVVHHRPAPVHAIAAALSEPRVAVLPPELPAAPAQRPQVKTAARRVLQHARPHRLRRRHLAAR